ncbi:TPA_asm: CPSF [Hydra adintovirus]|nr:TPA_asm: CPSF [Hydra adintovirus]
MNDDEINEISEFQKEFKLFEEILKFEFEESDSEDDTYYTSDEATYFTSDDEEEVKEKPIVPIPLKTVQIMELHKDKLKWINYVPTYNVINDDFPAIDNTSFKKHNKNRKFSFEKPFNVDINFTEDGKPSTIHFVEKLPIFCKNILKDNYCPFGRKCKYNHDIPYCSTVKERLICIKSSCQYRHLSLCSEYPKCKNKECRLFHPKKSELLKLRKAKTKLCKYILDKKECKNINCKYAHSKKEIEENVEICQYTPCKLVESKLKKNKKGEKILIYKNNDNKKCNFLHQGESILNYIARTFKTK